MKRGKTDEVAVVVVVVVGAGPERDDEPQAPRHVVTAMRVDGLCKSARRVRSVDAEGGGRRTEEAEDDPDVHGEDVEVALAQDAPENRASDGAGAEDEDLERVRVLCREAERGGKLVVELVDALVQRAGVESSVRPVVKETVALPTSAG